tara:strand:+ start:12549 stop:13445 length:897 start_codon:yes stop_codon:yes gene_type:complete
VDDLSVDSLLERCNFPQENTVVDCAVSGGPDSLALLILAVHQGLDVTAWHVDHGLREGSSAEGEKVTEAADRLGAKSNLVTVSVTDGPNLEARARDARREALPKDVLTGHTADDQAETVLLNLLRGAGLPGTAGIGEPHRRPLLGIRREETLWLCSHLGFEPIRDPMNEDPRFTRSRVRHEVIPLLLEVFGRDPVPLLTRHSDHAREANELLNDLIKGIDPTDTRSLSKSPEPIVRLVIHRWLTESRQGIAPESAAVERVLAVVNHEARATDVGDGDRVERSNGKLRFSSASNPIKSG